MYIEEYISEIVKNAARQNAVRHLSASEIYTDMTATGEWEGVAKLYILREETKVIGDLSDAWTGGGAAESTVTITAVGADKLEALETVNDAVRALKSYIRITGFGGETVTIDEGETANISAGETMAAETVIVNGELGGGGRLIAEHVGGGGENTAETNPNPIDGVLVTAASGIQRWENGAFRDQYYQTRIFKFLHQLEL